MMGFAMVLGRFWPHGSFFLVDFQHVPSFFIVFSCMFHHFSSIFIIFHAFLMDFHGFSMDFA